MKKQLIVSILMVVTLLFFCQVSNVFAGGEKGKMPITTSSKKAMEHYLKGRELAEKLRLLESTEHFYNATSEDPDFAVAYLNLAFSQPTTQGFLDAVGMAVDLLDKVSDGEKLWIRGIQAGAIDGDFPTQEKCYRELINLYPNDERAHNLLANYYFGIQQYDKAIEQFEKSIKINPEFSPAYNILGYSYRSLGDFKKAEKAFKKYIKLIPDDPNPYDSYAELLMKMGKYDSSIKNYQKALDLNPQFAFSHTGIASNLIFKGEHEQARVQLEKMIETAANDAVHRNALFVTALSYIDEGDLKSAMKVLQKRYGIVETADDTAGMANDMVLFGNVLIEHGKASKAQSYYEKGLQLIESSSINETLGKQARLTYVFNTARVDLENGDINNAKKKALEYGRKAHENNSVFQILNLHQLNGMIAMKENKYEKALKEFEQANQQNPHNLYRMANAYEQKGDKNKAKEFYERAAKFNGINSLSYAYIRANAYQKISKM